MKDHILANGGQKLLSPTRRSTCRTTSDEAERFAEVRMLPALGSTGSYHARFASHRLGFDLRATHRTRRVPVDASTGASDGLVGGGRASPAEALRRQVFVLFVKPDFSKYQLAAADGSKTTQMQLTGLLAVE